MTTDEGSAPAVAVTAYSLMPTAEIEDWLERAIAVGLRLPQRPPLAHHLGLSDVAWLAPLFVSPMAPPVAPDGPPSLAERSEGSQRP